MYQEIGETMRHYSASRTAVLSTAVPVCVVILGVILSIADLTRTSLFLTVVEVVIFSYAWFLSVMFGQKYSQAQKLAIRLEGGERVAVHTAMAMSGNKGPRRLDLVDKSLLWLGVVGHVAFLALYCVTSLSGQDSSGTSQTQAPPGGSGTATTEAVR